MRIKKEKEYRELDGQLDQIMKTDVFQFSNDQLIQVKIHYAASSRRQGVVLISENGFLLEGKGNASTFILWADKINSEHIMTCVEGTMNLFNVWEEERMLGYHDQLSGMRIEKEQNGFIYYCQDSHTKEKDTSIIFSISLLSKSSIKTSF
ncbi:hypothetical protein LAV33_14725 [Bacillus safensis]|uniref:hypothetical protein n=1 Tax=Bacillus safensis TaxID=561879 RepID=UPI002B253131|nr:hypothetical protein [Bacillus safensis]MEB2271536.1 hypothetical protein [Bacillus safensis]